METPDYDVRIGVDRYRELPDGLRKAYLVGVLDMICWSYAYATPSVKNAIQAMAGYVGNMGTDEITARFDEYLAVNPHLAKFGAANSFFIALGKWAGLEK